MGKLVVTSTLESADWNNTTIIRDNLVEEAAKLKEQYTGDILVAGSGQLARTLLENDLVDEIRFMVHPLILGTGKRLFPGEFPKTVFQLADTKVVGAGIVVLSYVRQQG